MKQKKNAWKVRITILYFDPQAKMTCRNFIYYGLQWQLRVFEIMAHSTGQSWCMLESWCTVGAQNKDCRTVSQTDSAKNLVQSVPQAIMVHVPGT